MAPYTKTLSSSCANIYLEHAQNSGQTTLSVSNIEYWIRNSLWEAWRRADINTKLPAAEYLPSFNSFLLTAIRLINSKESNPAYRVALVTIRPGSPDETKFITTISEEQRNPTVTTGSEDKIDY